MKKLVVLDYMKPSLDIYDVEEGVKVDEEYVESIGFNTNTSHWMFGDGIQMTYHKEALK